MGHEFQSINSHVQEKKILLFSKSLCFNFAHGKFKNSHCPLPLLPLPPVLQQVSQSPTAVFFKQGVPPLPYQVNLKMSREIFDCHILGWSYCMWWVKARNGAKKAHNIQSSLSTTKIIQSKIPIAPRLRRFSRVLDNTQASKRNTHHLSFSHNGCQ